MSGVDLFGEFTASIEALTLNNVRRLRELGLDKKAILRVGGIGVARVTGRRDGTYELDECGAPALIFPVWDGPVSSRPALIDLAAWRLGEPAQPIVTRCGIGAVLGEEALELTLGQPLQIFRSPIDWAVAGGAAAGIVVLDWSTDFGILFVSSVITEDIEHGEEVKRHLQMLRRRMTPRLPPIAVPVQPLKRGVDSDAKTEAAPGASA